MADDNWQTRIPDSDSKPKPGYTRFYHSIIHDDENHNTFNQIAKEGLKTVADGRKRRAGYLDSEGDGIWLNKERPYNPNVRSIAVDLSDDEVKEFFDPHEVKGGTYVSRKSITPDHFQHYIQPDFWGGMSNQDIIRHFKKDPNLIGHVKEMMKKEPDMFGCDKGYDHYCTKEEMQNLIDYVERQKGLALQGLDDK